MFPGTNWVSRDKSRVVQDVPDGTPEQPVRTLDCGCGNAYFSHQAVARVHAAWGSRSTTGRSRTARRCARSSASPTSSWSSAWGASTSWPPTGPARPLRPGAAARRDRAHHGRAGCFRQIHDLLDEDGFVYITTPDRDWQAHSGRIRVTRFEDGWHVRNGYTFEQLEAVLRGGIRADRPAPVRHARLDGRDLDPAPALRLVDRPADGGLLPRAQARLLDALALAQHAHDLRAGTQAARRG